MSGPPRQPTHSVTPSRRRRSRWCSPRARAILQLGSGRCGKLTFIHFSAPRTTASSRRRTVSTMAQGNESSGSVGGVTFGHPVAFWLGVAAVTGGVLLHLPMYLMGKDNGYRLAGMPMETGMKIGMAAIIVGLFASLWGLFPRGGYATSDVASRIRVSALDDAPLTRVHYGLLLTMSIAVTIDIMKPTALAFVLPGMTTEYGLKGPLNPGGHIPVAYVALSGIIGTVLGSFLWGWLGDRIGRRASILYAG